MRQAVLLVGGRGTRLWPLTATMPKGLVPLAGVPFIEYQLRLLTDIGIEEAWLAVGTEHAAAWEAFANRRAGFPALHLAVEPEPLDTAGPVAALGERLDDRVLVLNGDVILDASLAGFIAAAPEAGAVLALVEVADPSAFGVVVTDAAGVVTRFVEKPEPGTAPANTVSAGVYVVSRRVLAGFEPGPLSFERRVFPELAARSDLGAVVVDGFWVDIGTPELFLDAHEVLLTGGSRLFATADAHAAAAGARVDGVCSGAWSWVAAGAAVEAGARIRESVILDGAVIHSGAVVERAVIGWESEIGPSASVAGDTIVGRGCVVARGCELGRGMRIAAGTELGERAVSFSPPG